MVKKYASEAERKEAVLEAKRRWRAKNKERIKRYNQDYYVANREALSRAAGHEPREIPDKPDIHWLVENCKWILRDLERMSQVKVAAKYNTNRRTLMRAVKNYRSQADA